MEWPIQVVDKWPDEPKPGDAWKAQRVNGDEHWLICLPNGTLWNPYGPSSDGTPWQVTGEMPNITVHPSIFPQPVYKQDGTLLRAGWHGWIRNGIITDN